MRGEVSTGHTDSRIPQEGRSLLRKVITSQRLTFKPSPDCKARSDLWAIGTPDFPKKSWYSIICYLRLYELILSIQ